MQYTVRLWVNQQRENESSTPSLEAALELFRTIVNLLGGGPTGLYVTVNAEPGPYPARSYTVASYQQPARAA